MWSPKRMMAEMKPTFALYPVGNRMAASLSLNSATALARATWMSKVPERLGIEVVAVGLGLAVPLVERRQQVEGIVAGAVIEVAVVVVAEHRFPGFLLVRRLHISLSAHAGPSDPLRGGTAV